MVIVGRSLIIIIIMYEGQSQGHGRTHAKVKVILVLLYKVSMLLESIQLDCSQQTIKTKWSLGCARFPQFVQNFSECQILWSLCSVEFHTLTLQLPIQTPHSVAPELQVFVSSLENCQNFGKTSTSQCVSSLDKP